MSVYVSWKRKSGGNATEIPEIHFRTVTQSAGPAIDEQSGARAVSVMFNRGRAYAFERRESRSAALKLFLTSINQ